MGCGSEVYTMGALLSFPRVRNPPMSYEIFAAEAGFEVRGAIMRLYASFRGGDRPKGAERETPIA